MKRDTAREIAVQLLFSKNFTEFDQELFFSEENFASLGQECDLYTEKLDKNSKDYICSVVTNYSEHADEVNAKISDKLKTWNIKRISGTALAVLRCSATELLFMKEIPSGASINSAVEISKKYDDPEVVSFINGVLGSIAKDI